jgi:hypothetical protein
LRDGMAENHQINVARDENLKGVPTREARHAVLPRLRRADRAAERGGDRFA